MVAETSCRRLPVLGSVVAAAEAEKHIRMRVIDSDCCKHPRHTQAYALEEFAARSSPANRLIRELWCHVGSDFVARC